MLIKFSLIFISLLASYAGGYYLRYIKKSRPRTGAVLIFLGSIIFGAGIYSIARICHINTPIHNWMLVFALAMFPMAYLVKFRSILSLAILALFAWFAMSVFYLVSPVGPHTNEESSFITMYGIAGILLWCVGLAHRSYIKLKPLAAPFFILGVIIVFLQIFYFTFFENWFRTPVSDQVAKILLYERWAIIAIMAIPLVAIVRAKIHEKWWFIEIVFLLFLMLFCREAFIYNTYFKGTFSQKDITLISNFIFAVSIVVMLVLGHVRRNRIYFDFGILFAVIGVIGKILNVLFRGMPLSIAVSIGALVFIVGGLPMILSKERYWSDHEG